MLFARTERTARLQSENEIYNIANRKRLTLKLYREIRGQRDHTLPNLDDRV